MVGEQFRADTERLRSTAPAFEQLGAEVAALVQRLEDLVASDTAPWGTDDTGRAFAETFAPEEKRTLSDLESLADVLRQTGPDLRQVATNFEHQDQLGDQLIRTADQEISNGAATASTNTAAGVDVPDSDITGSPDALAAGTQVALPGQVTDAAATSVASEISQGFGAAPGVLPDGSSGSAPAAGGPATDAQQQYSPRPQQQDGGRGSYEQPSIARRDTTAAASNTAPPTSIGGPRPTQNRGTVPTDVTGPARAGAAGSQGSPWSKTGASSPQRVAAAPGAGATETPPRLPGRFSQQPPEKSGDPEGRPIDASGESMAARLARELAERHNVRAFGFDTPGVPLAVLLEIVAAVDDVLPRHPAITLTAIGIDDLFDGVPVRLDLEPVHPDGASDDSRKTITGSASNPDTGQNLFAACITLAAWAAVEPAQLAYAVRADEDAGVLAPGCAQRPVYSSVVRELGRVLDAAGGFRARAATRHTLVAAYLPTAGPGATGSLARTVAGFVAWRAQLSGGFRARHFEPGAALVEAFTEVVLDVAHASPPARALHRLLVDTAATAYRRRDEIGDRTP